jgi:DNA-binding NtrC family response regulator
VSAAKVLVVDDEASLSETFARVLKGAGYDCSVANDGPTALKLLAAEAPQVAVLDLYLPPPDGLEITRYARLHHPETRVILMTAFSSPAVAEAALKAGACEYLTKPFSNARLLEAVNKALSGSSS